MHVPAANANGATPAAATVAAADLPGAEAKQFGWLAMIIAIVGAFGLGAAVVALGSTDITGTPAATPTLGESTAEPAGFTPKKSDFEIGIKILEKTCFGSRLQHQLPHQAEVRRHPGTAR